MFHIVFILAFVAILWEEVIQTSKEIGMYVFIDLGIVLLGYILSLFWNKFLDWDYKRAVNRKRKKERNSYTECTACKRSLTSTNCSPQNERYDRT